MSVKLLFTFKHFKFPLLPLLTHSAMFFQKLVKYIIIIIINIIAILIKSSCTGEAEEGQAIKEKQPKKVSPQFLSKCTQIWKR